QERAPQVDISCVTGLPARTIYRSCRLFLLPGGLLAIRAEPSPHGHFCVPGPESYRDSDRLPSFDSPRRRTEARPRTIPLLPPSGSIASLGSLRSKYFLLPPDVKRASHLQSAI